MGTFDLATGHADTFNELLDSLESELRDVFGHYREALAQPVQEPVAYVTGMSFGRFIVEPLNRAMVLPVGMALYSSPQKNT